MTEAEWTACSEPHAMLQVLRASGPVSERKLRLFAVACSRRMWALIDPLGRAAVEMAEKFADGLAGPEELRAARLACQGAGSQAAWYAAATNARIAARNAARSAQAGAAVNGSKSAELLAQAGLVREIFGLLPFRPSCVDSGWRTTKDVALAQEIYTENAFDRMPELAAALDEAGCVSQEVLAHFRGLGPHVRGCWVVDAVLGKE
jgi:hypothetical protein